MEKIRMHSINKVDENVEKIGYLFPNCVTEAQVDGKLTRVVDFDLLKQELSSFVVEGNEERYQFTWPDKKKSILLANAPIAKTLRPCPDESVDFDNTENLYIEGDNLEALKLLQETYLGKVKMIYIDPPYNTGNDFVYEDDFSQSVDEYLANSGQLDVDGNRLVQNTERNGRFHTDWLNMMYPRLKLSKNFMCDDGVIFISISDDEVHNLRKMCDEVFGELNFVAELIWQNKKGGGNDSLHIAVEHEYILVYAKSKQCLNAFYESYSEAYASRYKEEDDKGKYYWDTFKRKSGKQYYPIECPDGTVLETDDDGNPISWLRSKTRFEQDKRDGEVRFVQQNGQWSVHFKQRMPQGKKPRSLFIAENIIDDKGTTSTGADDLFKYFKKDVFSNPKPVALLNFLLGFGVGENDIVLDFFSGSGSICEAVMFANSIDNGKRKYIAVQVQEKIEGMLASSNANARRVTENAISVLIELGLPLDITSIAKERIRRAGDKIKEDAGLTAQNLDTGFRVLKVDSTNMKDVFYTPDAFNRTLFDDLTDNIKEDRTPLDLLFQVMLEMDVLLSSKIVETEISGKKVYSVMDDYMIACFDTGITAEVVEAIAKKQPYYAVFRDSCMADDSTMASFEQIFETYSKDTIRKVL